MIRDLKHALRSLGRRPLLTSVAVLSLALGIGVNSAIFSVFDRLLLRRLSIPAPEEVVNVTSPGPRGGRTSTTGAGGREAVFSYPLFRDLEELDRTGLSSLAAYREFGANLAFGGQTSSGGGLVVSGGYFPALGVTPALGRLLTRDDDQLQAAPVVVLSYSYWASRFGSDSQVLGQTLTVNGEPVTIVGVATASFRGLESMESPEIFVPLAMTPRVRADGSLDRRDDHWLYIVARLESGTTREQAQGLINVPFTGIIRDVEFPAQSRNLSQRAREEFMARRIVLEDGSRGVAGQREETRTVLMLLMAVTGFVLLIACANVANLLLARAADRYGEVAVRRSLGASTGQLARLFLTESCAIGLLGGIAGLVVARMTFQGILAIMPADDQPLLGFDLTARVLVFTLGLGVASGCVLGLVPAVPALRRDPASGLTAQSTRTSASRAARRFRAGLATAQIALATALLAQAGLFMTSLSNVARVELGIRREGVVTFSIAPYRNGYTQEQALAFFERLEDELRGLPGVTSVAASNLPLLSYNNQGSNVSVEGFEAGPDADTRASAARIGPGYFDTVGIPLLAGRDFTRTDHAGAAPVAIVNEAFARHFRLGPDVIGKRMARGATRKLDIEIVGLVRDAKYSDVKAQIPPQFFQPYRQFDVGPLTFYVRSNGESRALLPAIAPRVARLDPNLPVESLRTMDDQIWDNITRDRVLATLSTAFAGLATLLAAIGLYAVLAYSVTQRLREIGIRMALGATTRDVRRLVLTHVGGLTLAGITIGVAAALGLSRLGESLLFGLEGFDPAILASAAGVVLLVTLAAGAVPAGRAAAVNPVEALRGD